MSIAANRRDPRSGDNRAALAAIAGGGRYGHWHWSRKCTGSRQGRFESGATSRSSWAHFSHDADIGVVGVGPTRAEAFRQAALALTAVVTDPSRVRPSGATGACVLPDNSDEMLLVEWLNALVYEMAVRTMLFADFAVEIDGRELRGTAYGEPIDLDRHEPAVEIEGATLTALQVAEGPDGWRAQCVVDV